jgi:hypothetical protein
MRQGTVAAREDAQGDTLVLLPRPLFNFFTPPYAHPGSLYPLLLVDGTPAGDFGEYSPRNSRSLISEEQSGDLRESYWAAKEYICIREY